ncbi:MAG: ParB/RepB/Spo0J family partition protein [Bacillota bacterium]|nr:ParB/RepB/Spo0J family partition protein [Bacillota bacterium]
MPARQGWFFGRKRPTSGRAERPPDAPALPEGATLQQIPIDRVSTNPYQPRNFAEGDPALAELAESIRCHGLLQPILVSRQGDGYVLVAGERRWRAAALAGLTTVPALVGEFGPREMAENALLENLQRRDLTCLEEAEAYRRLLEEFGLTQEELAARLGRSQPAVANKLRLLRLPEKIRESISREIISEGHARALLMLESAQLQEVAHAEIVRRSLSVRQAEELVRGMAGGKGVSRRRKTRRQVVRVFKDARLFRNSLLALVSQMRQGGAAVEIEEAVTADYYEVHLRLQRKPERQKGGAAGAEEGERQWARS